jgi:hypothetical protein
LDEPARLGNLSLLWIVGWLLMSGLTFGVTAWSCNSTDGSFTLDDPFARPSRYCKAAGLSGPISPGALMQDLLIYFAPAVALMVAWRVAVVKDRPSIFYVFAAGSVVITVIQCVLLTGSNVGYAGQG